MSTPQLSPGTVVDGRFTVGAVLRTRQGATIYEATGPDGAAVALTIYGAECFPSGLVLERALRELRQLQSVESDRVLRVLEAGKHGDGIFEVTEPLPGPALTEHLQSGAVPMSDAAALIVQIGEALLDAQRAGVMHRNLGATCVFPSPAGVKVTGFAVGEPHGGSSFGPLDTVAPEQVQGKVVDQRTLIYNVAALMHFLLSGAPLFAGDAASVLEAHVGQEPSADVHEVLRRALSKDPRMRPMMLKQFLGDIAKLGGVAMPRSAPVPSARPAAPGAPAPRPAAPAAAAPAAAKPSTRGWTMFMQAQDDAGDQESPATPEPAAPAKPSTRGWTMFMEAQDDGGASSSESAGGPAQEPAAAPAAKPSTRGWTMFMEAEGEGDASPEQASSPAAEQPAPAAPAAAPAAKPSTRGWTMFMEAQDDAAAASPGSSEPSAANPEPTPAQPAAPAAAPAAKPSTRGWTMFMEAQDDGAETSQAPSESAAAEPTPPPAAAASPTTPSSRGWTMFMEDSETSGARPQSKPVEPEADAPSPEEGAPGGRKKGWTMFMDAPLQEVDKDIGGPKTPAPNVEADTKGWTVFGTPSPLAKSDEGQAPAVEPADPGGAAPRPERPTMVVTGPPTAAASTSPPPAAGGTVVSGAPSPAPGELDPNQAPVKGKTVIASGMQAQSGTAGGVTGRTVFAGGGSDEQPPDTMYFKRGESEPERPASPRAPTVPDIEAPAARAAVERAASAAPQVRPVNTGSHEIAVQTRSRAPMFVVAAVVAAGVAAGAWFMLT